MGFKVAPMSDREVVPFAAPDVEQGGARRQVERLDFLPQRPQERRAVPRVEEPPPRLDGRQGIPGDLRPPVLRLEQVGVAAPREVEGVPPRAGQRAVPPFQGLAAAADRADQECQGRTCRAALFFGSIASALSAAWAAP
jgi:hypothetical protein